MLIDIRKIFRRKKIKGILQVGAHRGQEVDAYIEMGVRNIILIEPCADAFAHLKKKYGKNPYVKLFNTAIGNYTGQVTMNVETANGGMSNSILEPTIHLDQYPDIKFQGTEIVDITRLDDLDFDRSQYDFLMMDCQCYEGEVLKGATETLKSIQYIMTEVNLVTMYDKCTLLEDLKKLIPDFELKESKFVNHSWGDAIFYRR